MPWDPAAMLWRLPLLSLTIEDKEPWLEPSCAITARRGLVISSSLPSPALNGEQPRYRVAGADGLIQVLTPKEGADEVERCSA